ncbi:hypothetical protein CcaverHIS002_0100150 [Cutaneotrichosporon cavernicola]|uniref:Mitochondrial carrier n=1 Tax=Cutaneotrichosporon cavernicola TaxID=279322 RepID=A0AA48I3Q2_9TREE|nr:uncharacterized protein CcaverHIS019_0100130 [Cutaneotrichosporon cavernicola]BEI79486.1 hypothetical protein CcaverHIS002_0100150 [Cutaneotrichosporon cavernicola]BEI87295.1 hypothetical protein CcaverHIS019_0100130 [Cutaneotrichosporon cavernicola]
MGEEADPGGAVRDLVCGTIAGMAAKLFEHPFDLVKVRLQSQPIDRPAQFKGPLDCFKYTVKNEGAVGLYRGLSAPIFGAAVENATLFFVYNRCQAAIYKFSSKPAIVDGVQRELSIPELALAGAGAGAVTSFALTPIELIKCRMQVQMIAPGVTATGPVVIKTALEAPGSPSSTVTLPANLANTKAPLKGPFALIADTVRQSGLRGLWLGQTGTFLRETGGSAAWFGTYELVARLLIQRHQKNAPPGHVATKADLAAWELMLAGGMGGIAYNVSLFPADCVKSTMQTHAELNPNKPVPGFGATFMNIYRTRGIRGLYAGCGLTCLRSGPSSAMIFGLFETLRIHFGWVFEPGFGKHGESDDKLK